MIRSMLSDWWLTMPVCAWHLSSRSLRSWLCITACVKQAGFIYYYYVKKKKKKLSCHLLPRGSYSTPSRKWRSKLPTKKIRLTRREALNWTFVYKGRRHGERAGCLACLPGFTNQTNWNACIEFGRQKKKAQLKIAPVKLIWIPTTRNDIGNK